MLQPRPRRKLVWGGVEAGGVKPVASGRAWAWARCGPGQGEGGREKRWERQVRSRAGRPGRKDNLDDGQASTSSGKWSSWGRKETRCMAMLHDPCRTSLPISIPSWLGPCPISQLVVPFPAFQLSASPLALAELSCWRAEPRGGQRLGSLP
jgi:hypothetical protein